VLLFHHDPDRTDDEVAAMAAGLASPDGPAVAVATERTTLFLDATPRARRA
jgi:hypothetical protein